MENLEVRLKSLKHAKIRGKYIQVHACINNVRYRFSTRKRVSAKNLLWVEANYKMLIDQHILETLIKAENGTTSDGQTYDHVFTDEIKNMSGEEFTDKLASVWVKELDGIITRSKQSNQATTLDSLNVVFSKTPNSYIQRSESADELQVNSFTQSWNDPSETDYIHELFFYIVYSQAGVNFTMEKVKETWLAQKNHAGDNNVSNTPEKRQTFINVGLQTSGDKVGAIGQIFKQAYETDMKDELFEAYDVAPYKMRLKESIYQLSNSELIELFTRACQKVYAITK